jgi:hypothetical protein
MIKIIIVFKRLVVLCLTSLSRGQTFHIYECAESRLCDMVPISPLTKLNIFDQPLGSLLDH